MGADSVEGVADVVTENLLAVLALEEVVTVGVEGPGAEAAGSVGEGLGEDGQAKLALVEEGEGVILSRRLCLKRQAPSRIAKSI